MRSWNLVDYEVEPQRPQVLGTTAEGRAVLVNLPAGDSMPDHHVRERATVLIISGRIGITAENGDAVDAETGAMVVFEPSERHSVVAHEDSRFLLLLSPWSLDEHSSLNPWSSDDS